MGTLCPHVNVPPLNLVGNCHNEGDGPDGELAKDLRSRGQCHEIPRQHKFEDDEEERGKDDKHDYISLYIVSVLGVQIQVILEKTQNLHI